MRNRLKEVLCLCLCIFVFTSCKTAGGSEQSSESSGDIYTTYYCAESLELLGEPLSDGYITDCLKYYEEYGNYYFFDDKATDNLLNIYYFCKLADKVGYESGIKGKILTEIYALQYDEGNFDMSEQEIRGGENEALYLTATPTKMALESTLMLKGEISNADSWEIWMTDRFDNFENEIG